MLCALEHWKMYIRITKYFVSHFILRLRLLFYTVYLLSTRTFIFKSNFNNTIAAHLSRFTDNEILHTKHLRNIRVKNFSVSKRISPFLEREALFVKIRFSQFAISLRGCRSFHENQ